jgi:Protein of unknown function (DUF3050)
MQRPRSLINDIVIGEETDIDPGGSYVSHLDLYRRAMADIGAITLQFDGFCSLAVFRSKQPRGDWWARSPKPD